MSKLEEREFRTAGEADKPVLAGLWRECFGDADELIDLFFRERFCPERAFLLSESGEPASMLYMLPAALVTGAGEQRIHYVYAVGTRKEKRGRGLAAALLSRAEQAVGTPCLLVPSEESLFSWYESLGYRERFAVREAVFAPIPGKRFSMEREKLSAAQYLALRDAAFFREGYVKWDFHAADYALRLARMEEGGAVRLSGEGGSGIVLYDKRQETLCVTETSLPEPVFKEALSLLARQEGCLRVRVRLPVYSVIPGNQRAFALYKGTALPPDSYFNLALD